MNICEKQNQLSSLQKKYKDLFESKEIVFGSGNINADIVLIGEAPGKDEVKLNKPFVGQAGKNLMQFLDILDLDRDKIYITNAIKFRLSKLNESTGRLINRPATRDEVIKNRDFLINEIEIINPSLVITLGNIPLRSIIGDMKKNIGELHGMDMIIPLSTKKQTIFPLYHPASIIYNQKLKEIYINDLAMLKTFIKNT